MRQVVEPVAAGQRAAVEQRRRSESDAQLEQGGAALTEQIAVAQLVDRVFEIQPAQERIRGQLRGAQDVAAAVGLRPRRTRAACARAGRNRPTPSGEPAAASGPRGAPRQDGHARGYLSICSCDVDIGLCHRRRGAIRASAARLIAEIAVAAIGGCARGAARSPPISAGSTGISCRRGSCRVAGTSLIETVVRVVIAALGVWLALVVRPRVGRLVARAPARALHVAIAARPGARRRASWCSAACTCAPPSGWCPTKNRAAARSAARLDLRAGAHRAQHASADASIDYAFDPAGYRVRRVDEPVDPERPTILFTGESVMFGEGLTWEESVPAQVGAMMGMQSANLAVHGFGSDQAYLRLADRAAAFSPAGRGGLAVHDRALRPEPGRRSAASRRRAWSGCRRNSTRGWRRSPSCSCRTAATRPSSAASP